MCGKSLKERQQKRLERLQKLLREMNGSGMPIIVEGKRDAAALRSMGLANEILALNGNADALARHVSERFGEAAVLTDFDESGEEMHLRVSEALAAYGVLPALRMRRRFRQLLGVRCVEEAGSRMEHIKNLSGDISNGQDIHRYCKVSRLRGHRDKRTG
jgi:5S rRNA maturation endonuclease (ribonuclease M5)